MSGVLFKYNYWCGVQLYHSGVNCTMDLFGKPLNKMSAAFYVFVISYYKYIHQLIGRLVCNFSIWLEFFILELQDLMKFKRNRMVNWNNWIQLLSGFTGQFA